MASLELLAEAAQSGSPAMPRVAALCHALDELVLPAATADGLTPLAQSVSTQFTRSATELGALLRPLLPAGKGRAAPDQSTPAPA
jgi:hypothetical protein